MSIPITPHISAGVIGVSAAIPANFLESLALQGEILLCEVEPDLAKLSGKSIALFLLSAQIGIPPNFVAYWDCARELPLPRLILVSGLTDGEIDFDDIVMIANRILDPVVTPFLVLHAENGRPNGLINIATSQTYNYSTAPTTITAADPDLITLVSEFAAEYREQLEEFGEAGFADGLLFPCIPFIPELQIGIAEAQSYITLIPKL
ncbi:unannotated protein [freshwater metagenome]|uniref:Unannotated protein n=1 Tax=freshwater metagenome TaxID=449393 RepID=A0A6J6MSZ5_9ZZZZ|nr:hypothetical protein [Actinomycetota bacterium]